MRLEGEILLQHTDVSHLILAPHRSERSHNTWNVAKEDFNSRQQNNCNKPYT